MTKNELRQYRRLGEEIEDLKVRIADLRSASLKSPKLDGMPHAQGGSGDPIGATIARIDVLAAQIVAREAERNIIEMAIASLKDSKERMVLRHRYMDGMTWEEIGSIMSYSEGRVRQLHGEALKELEDW